MAGMLGKMPSPPIGSPGAPGTNRSLAAPSTLSTARPSPVAPTTKLTVNLGGQTSVRSEVYAPGTPSGRPEGTPSGRGAMLSGSFSGLTAPPPAAPEPTSGAQAGRKSSMDKPIKTLDKRKIQRSRMVKKIRLAMIRAASISSFSSFVPRVRVTLAQALFMLYPFLLPPWAEQRKNAVTTLLAHPQSGHLCLKNLMMQLRATLNLPDWVMMATAANPNPFKDSYPGSVQAAKQPEKQNLLSVTAMNSGGGPKHQAWRWHIDYADFGPPQASGTTLASGISGHGANNNVWRCIHSDKELYWAIRTSLLRKKASGAKAAAAAHKSEGGVDFPGTPKPSLTGPMSPSGTTVPSLNLAQALASKEAAQAAASAFASVLGSIRPVIDLRIRVCVGAKCQHLEPLGLENIASIGKSMYAFLRAPVPAAPSCGTSAGVPLESARATGAGATLHSDALRVTLSTAQVPAPSAAKMPANRRGQAPLPGMFETAETDAYLLPAMKLLAKGPGNAPKEGPHYGEPFMATVVALRRKQQAATRAQERAAAAAAARARASEKERLREVERLKQHAAARERQRQAEAEKERERQAEQARIRQREQRAQQFSEDKATAQAISQVMARSQPRRPGSAIRPTSALPSPSAASTGASPVPQDGVAGSLSARSHSSSGSEVDATGLRISSLSAQPYGTPPLPPRSARDNSPAPVTGDRMNSSRSRSPESQQGSPRLSGIALHTSSAKVLTTLRTASMSRRHSDDRDRLASREHTGRQLISGGNADTGTPIVSAATLSRVPSMRHTTPLGPNFPAGGIYQQMLSSREALLAAKAAVATPKETTLGLETSTSTAPPTPKDGAPGLRTSSSGFAGGRRGFATSSVKPSAFAPGSELDFTRVSPRLENDTLQAEPPKPRTPTTKAAPSPSASGAKRGSPAEAFSVGRAPARAQEERGGERRGEEADETADFTSQADPIGAVPESRRRRSSIDAHDIAAAEAHSHAANSAGKAGSSPGLTSPKGASPTAEQRGTRLRVTAVGGTASDADGNALPRSGSRSKLVLQADASPASKSTRRIAFDAPAPPKTPSSSSPKPARQSLQQRNSTAAPVVAQVEDGGSVSDTSSARSARASPKSDLPPPAPFRPPHMDARRASLAALASMMTIVPEEPLRTGRPIPIPRAPSAASSNSDEDTARGLSRFPSDPVITILSPDRRGERDVTDATALEMQLSPDSWIDTQRLMSFSDLHGAAEAEDAGILEQREDEYIDPNLLALNRRDSLGDDEKPSHRHKRGQSGNGQSSPRSPRSARSNRQGSATSASGATPRIVSRRVRKQVIQPVPIATLGNPEDFAVLESTHHHLPLDAFPSPLSIASMSSPREAGAPPPPFGFQSQRPASPGKQPTNTPAVNASLQVLGNRPVDGAAVIPASERVAAPIVVPHSQTQASSPTKPAGVFSAQISPKAVMRVNSFREDQGTARAQKNTRFADAAADVKPERTGRVARTNLELSGRMVGNNSVERRDGGQLQQHVEGSDGDELPSPHDYQASTRRTARFPAPLQAATSAAFSAAVQAAINPPATARNGPPNSAAANALPSASAGFVAVKEHAGPDIPPLQSPTGPGLHRAGSFNATTARKAGDSTARRNGPAPLQTSRATARGEQTSRAVVDAYTADLRASAIHESDSEEESDSSHDFPGLGAYGIDRRAVRRASDGLIFNNVISDLINNVTHHKDKPRHSDARGQGKEVDVSQLLPAGSAGYKLGTFKRKNRWSVNDGSERAHEPEVKGEQSALMDADLLISATLSNLHDSEGVVPLEQDMFLESFKTTVEDYKSTQPGLGLGLALKLPEPQKMERKARHSMISEQAEQLSPPIMVANNKMPDNKMAAVKPPPAGTLVTRKRRSKIAVRADESPAAADAARAAAAKKDQIALDMGIGGRVDFRPDSIEIPPPAPKPSPNASSFETMQHFGHTPGPASGTPAGVSRPSPFPVNNIPRGNPREVKEVKERERATDALDMMVDASAHTGMEKKFSASPIATTMPPPSGMVASKSSASVFARAGEASMSPQPRLPRRLSAPDVDSLAALLQATSTTGFTSGLLGSMDGAGPLEEKPESERNTRRWMPAIRPIITGRIEEEEPPAPSDLDVPNVAGRGPGAHGATVAGLLTGKTEAGQLRQPLYSPPPMQVGFQAKGMLAKVTGGMMGKRFEDPAPTTIANPLDALLGSPHASPPLASSKSGWNLKRLGPVAAV